MKSFVLAAALVCAFALARAETVGYRVDPTHAAVFYAISHFGTSTNRGRFNVKAGTVRLDRAARTGEVEVTIDTATPDTGVTALDEHLASKDFFDAAEFPTAKFVAAKVGFDGDKVSEVTGELTLRGQTHPVTLKAIRFNCYINPVYKREVCGGDFETTIQRSLWGISWGLNYGFPDNVQLAVQVEAIKQ
jgi:polyisoprenoid-binding protein YceI